MDRNDQFRKRLENRLNQSINKDTAVRSRTFDPTPYVNILMENILWEEDEEELEDSLNAVSTDPELDFILGKSSLLNLAQKQMVIKALQQRLYAISDFDPEPYADELLDSKEKYEVQDEDEEVEYNFTRFFEQNSFTKEQRSMIEDCFYEQLNADDEYDSEKVVYNNMNSDQENEEALKKTKSPFLILGSITLLCCVIPPFFIPNFLQQIGWLSPNIGWFPKIFVGAISCFLLFFISTKIFDRILLSILKKNQAK